jgi:hypothetical protein
MLGKTFGRLLDETLRWQTERLLALETGRDGHVVHVRPELVAEIAFSDVQEGRPRYPAGLALRFARVNATGGEAARIADTLATVMEIFRRQRNRLRAREHSMKAPIFPSRPGRAPSARPGPEPSCSLTPSRREHTPEGPSPAALRRERRTRRRARRPAAMMR